MIPVKSESGIPGPLPVVQSKELGNLKVGMSLYLGAFFLVYVGVYIPHMEIPKIDVSENMDSLYANLEGVQESLSTVLPSGNVLQKFDIDIIKETLEDGFNGAWSSIGSLVENASINKGEYSAVDEGYVSDEDDMKNDEKTTLSEGAIAIDEVDAPLKKQVDEKEIEEIEQAENNAESMATLEVKLPHIEEDDSKIIEEDIPAEEAVNQDKVPSITDVPDPITEEKIPVIEEEIVPEIAYTVESEEIKQEETMPTATEAVPVKVSVIEEEIIPEIASTVGSEEITPEETMPTATEAVPVKVSVIEEEIIPEIASTVGSEEITPEETMPAATESVPVKVSVIEEEIIPEIPYTVESEEITQEETMPTATETVPVLESEAPTEEDSTAAGEGEIKADIVEETKDDAVEVTETLAKEDTEPAPIGLESVVVKEESVHNEGNIPLDAAEKKIVSKSEHISELDATAIDEKTKSVQTETVEEEENSSPIVSQNKPIKEELIVNDAARDSVPTGVKESEPLKEEVTVDEDEKNNPINTESHSEVKS